MDIKDIVSQAVSDKLKEAIPKTGYKTTEFGMVSSICVPLVYKALETNDWHWAIPVSVIVCAYIAGRVYLKRG